VPAERCGQISGRVLAENQNVNLSVIFGHVKAAGL
jgi:hypothetical protein